MKNLMIIFICLISGVLIIQSCSKEIETTDNVVEKKTENQLEFEEFQNTLIYAISLRDVAKDEKLVIWKVNEKYDWASTLDSNFEEREVELRSDYDCESTSAYTFAKCVKELIDDGKCVKVWSENGTYYGDEIDCEDDE